ncbi:seven-hairpin glycosidase [Mycena leptocephala]|nr:seven-hairpin glycosidase [Mycena leptocephala]
MRFLSTSAEMALEFLLVLVGGVTIQKPGLLVPSNYTSRSDDVKTMFTTSYAAYKKYAFPHDDLAPISTGNFDFRNGWGASVVDAMVRFWCCLRSDSQDIFLDAVNFSSQIDFTVSKVDETVSVFETTIRYIGGLLASYELSGAKYPVLVAKAKEVADKLTFAWVGDNEIPYGFLNFTTNAPQIATTNIAEAGSLTLEWSTLSKYTNNATYENLATTSAKHIANLPAPLPALAPQLLDPATGDFVGAYIVIPPKYARLTNTDDPIYIDTWKVDILLKISTVGNHTYLADMDDDGQIRHVGSHLACFHAGNWLYGGMLVQNQTIVDYGLKLNEGCWVGYPSPSTGIGPELFSWISPDGNFTGGDPPTAEQLEFYNEHGFYITNSLYILRPEGFRRVTGDTKYLDRASGAIDSFNKYLAASSGGFAGLSDVDNVANGFWDVMESFWFAEVLKYLYLTFDDPTHISIDDYVFNTECQPFKAPPALDSYQGSGKMMAAKSFTVHDGVAPAATVSGLPRSH